LQGKGRPDITGKLHMIELPFYALILWSLVKDFGVVGAAASWTIRVVIDTAALFVLGVIHVPEVRHAQLYTVVLTVGVASFLAALALPQALWLKSVIAFVIVAGGAGWMLKELSSMSRGRRMGGPAVNSGGVG
jgi:hypothetical protein